MPEGTMSKSLVGTKNSSKAITELVAATPRALSRVSSVYPHLEWKPFLRTYTAIEQDGMKAIVDNEGSIQLYDLRVDPLEGQNLALAHAAEARDLAEGIAAWKGSFKQYDPASGDRVIVRGKDKEVRQQLEALGYLGEWEPTDDKDEDY